MGLPAANFERARDWSLRTAIRGSRYPRDARRDERIDFLRGLFVAMMVIDHIAGFSLLRVLTGNADFYVTAAEGFVTISGFTFGMVYRRHLAIDGPASVLRRAVRRSFILYVAMVVGSLVLALTALLARLDWAPPVHDVSDFGVFAFRVATFQTMFPVARVLGMYAIVVLLGGFGIIAVARGWTRALLVASWALYLVYQISPRRFGWPFPDSAYFHPYAYQVLFLTMMVLGYHRDRLEAVMDPIWQRRIFIASALAFAGFIVLFLAQYSVMWERPALLLGKLFHRDFLRPGRLVVLAMVAPFFYLGATYLWVPLHRHFGGLFLPLGRHSLYCYMMHMPFVAFFERAALAWSVAGPWANLLNAGAQLAVLGLLCVMVRFRVLFRLFPN